MNTLRMLWRPVRCQGLIPKYRVHQKGNIQITRCFATQANAKPAIEEVAECPPATCDCKEIPDGLEIDHEGSIRGRMPFYTSHLVACTGQSDWTSKIEDDPKGWLAKGLREAFLPKPGVTRHEPRNPALETPLISYSSFTPELVEDARTARHAGLYLFPQFKYVQWIRASGQESFDYARLSETLTSNEVNPAVQLTNIDGFAILICGHGGRDQRCGVIAPLLMETFRSVLSREGFKLDDSQPSFRGRNWRRPSKRVRMASISHIGGHKWAGNVIIYCSPRLTEHPLAGRGVWLGRVAPKHVEGIVSEVLVKGRIIGELLRGVTDVEDRNAV